MTKQIQNKHGQSGTWEGCRYSQEVEVEVMVVVVARCRGGGGGKVQW